MITVTNEEKRMAGTYEITHSFEIGTKEVIMGEDKNASPEERYCVANCKCNGIFEKYTDVLVSDDYLEIVKIFARRIEEEAINVKTEIAKTEVDITPITIDDCKAVSYAETIKNKVVVIRAEVFKPEHQLSIKQLQLCTGGFGSEANSRGSACFCTNLYSGTESRFERRDILGVIEKENLPEWAKAKLAAIQNNQEKQRKDRNVR